MTEQHNSSDFIFANIPGAGSDRDTLTQAPEMPKDEAKVMPITEDEHSVSYLGVRLEKSKAPSGFVPERDKYADYISDRFSLELQQKIAVSLLQGDPMLIEGGTSIGKTTTVRKMCAELGWEVHYANLNGATDVEDLMGRYIPNPNKTHPDDPEYIFADGKVTSGLRQEEGKKKVIILDEFNSSAPNILIRLHEVLDALERDGEVVLSEDASEVVHVGRESTKVIALMNPPGRGYFGREPLDPAQLRRWVYQKEVTELPASTFAFSTTALFGVGLQTEQIPTESYLTASDQAISRERLAEIPGIKEILAKYQEFHIAAKEMIKQRQVAADQPQPFTFDDRMEPHRISSFVARFYSGDLNETFQKALRYYYVNKLESAQDRQKLEELINHVAYTPPIESRRRGLDQTEPDNNENALKSKTDQEITNLLLDPALPDSVKAALRSESVSTVELDEAKELLGKDFLGPESVAAVFGPDSVRIDMPPILIPRQELEDAARKKDKFLILRSNRIPADKLALSATKKSLEKAPDTCWALVTKDIIADTTSKNYVEQTEQMIKYLQENIFAGREIPSEYQEAITEFEAQKEELRLLAQSSDESQWKLATERLSNLNITRLCRPTRDEVLYDMEVYYQANDERLFPDKYTWTSTRDSDGHLVDVGGFDAGGASVGRDRPDDRDAYLGVSFSRSLS